MASYHQDTPAKEEQTSTLSNFAIIISEEDNVATLIRDVKKGTRVKINGDEIEISQDISFGHKFALRDISKGEYVMKYGIIIGQSKAPIKKGEHVHIHNVQDITGELRDKVRAGR
jgi:altronate dehydratase small subunit